MVLGRIRPFGPVERIHLNRDTNGAHWCFVGAARSQYVSAVIAMLRFRANVLAIGLLLSVLGGSTGYLAELFESADPGDCGCRADCSCRRSGQCTCKTSGLRMRAACSCGQHDHDPDRPPPPPERKVRAPPPPLALSLPPRRLGPWPPPGYMG